MFKGLAFVLSWALWFLGTAAVIRFDAGRQRAAAQARGEVDFMDRSVAPYLLLAVFCGALPTIFYFGTTRRGGRGWLLGLGVFAAQFVALCGVSFALSAAGAALDRP